MAFKLDLEKKASHRVAVAVFTILFALLLIFILGFIFVKLL